ncbi:MAG: TonB-dependent receptor [Acidobacteriaceae bacterium]|nr:TonB-dependent receptor [Acidobacteriaceae bacterium]
MRGPQFFRAISVACLITELCSHLSAAPFDGATAGAIRGIVQNIDKQAVAGASVVIHNVQDNTDRSVVSGSDGAFVVVDLDPGEYRLVANKDGVGVSSAITVNLSGGQTLSANVIITPAESKKQGTPNFFARLANAYSQDWKGTESGPAPPFRGYPAPVDSPPFPFSVWPYGGSPVIGQPWTNSPPLMQALWGGSSGQAWRESGVQIYGWLNAGFNISSSNKGGYDNYPTAYDERGNTIQPDQEVLYIERQPDTVQTEHFDWGFRLTNLWGLDYRFTTSKGIFSNQLLGRNQEYGYDPVMAYVDLYWGQVAQGLNVRIGRYISLPDIEAQLAPNNYTYSHSILYTFDAYTQTGINTTWKLNKHWILQAGISAGNDVAPWARDARATFNGCVSYTWQEGRDNHYACLNSLNSGHYAYNNLQSVYYTWYHKFKNHPWHTATESWYMWENAVPNVLNPNAASLIETNANGAVCNNTTTVTCFADEWAVVSYVERQFNRHNYLTIRNEYFDDIKGQRTGFRSRYTEDLIGWGHWIGTTILLRPELRFEHSYDVPAYDNGTKKNQVTFAGDFIFFF